VPETASDPKPVSPDEAAHERAMLAAARDAEFRKQCLYMESPAADESWPPRRDVNSPPPYAPDGTPGEASPWPVTPMPNKHHSPGHQQWVQLVEHLRENPPTPAVLIQAGQAVAGVGQQLATLKADALARARKAYAESEAAAELTAARDALARAGEFQRQVAAEHQAAAAALRRAVEEGQANGKPAGRLAAAAATLGTAAGVARDAGERLRLATAAARDEWGRLLAAEERAIREEADAMLAEVVARFYQTFADQSAHFIHARRVRGGGKVLTEYAALEQAAAPAPAVEE
jgi:hypothetical protein